MIAWLVETLIVTTALVLLVLVLRNPVRQTFGAKVAYALWMLPALRLVMPPVTALVPESSPIASVAHSSGALSQLIRSRVVQLDAPALAATSGLSVNWPLVMAAFWLVGALAFAVWQVVSYRRFTRRILAGARVRRSPVKGVKLLGSTGVSGPLAFGLRKRFIVFPHDALMRFDVEEHAMALAHELAHHRRGDLFANAFALVFLALHWCNPIVWIAHRAFRADQEMACDADVITAIRDQGLGHAYGRALVKCASGRDSLAICHLTTVDRLKRRLSMLSKKSPSRRRRYAGLAITGGVILSGLALTVSGQGMAAQMGAKVSEALPLPERHQFAPVVQAMLAASGATQQAAQAQRQAYAAEAAAQAEETRAEAEEARARAEEERARAQELMPPPLSPPPAPRAPLASALVPPVPPAPPSAPVPPAPPSIAGTPKVIPMPATDARKYNYAYRVERDFRKDIPSKAEIDAMVPIIRVTRDEGCDRTSGVVNTSERRTEVNGKVRHEIAIRICNSAVARDARREAIRGLQEARNDIAREEELSDKTRSQILTDLDRQIQRLRAARD